MAIKRLIIFLARYALGSFLLLFLVFDILMLAFICTEIYYGELLIRKDLTVSAIETNNENIKALDYKYNGKTNRLHERLKAGKL